MVIRSKTLILILSLLMFTGFTLSLDGNQTDFEFDYIYMDGCPYCAQQEAFHEELKEDYPKLEIEEYDLRGPDIESDIEYLEEKHNVTVQRLVSPMTFVEGKHFTGFDPQVEAEIRKIVESNFDGEKVVEENERQYIPYLGEVDLGDYSLIFLAIILGLIDGLNVCSIGALILILGIVVKFDSRRKILLYGGLFLLTTVLVYGGLIFVWYEFVEAVISHLGMLNLLIGTAGVLGGLYLFREFLQFYRYGPQCKTTGSDLMNRFSGKVSDRLRDDNAGLIAAAVAIVLFAAVITLVELPCSAALPLVFTGVLADASLASSGHIFYILIYLVMYMMVELVIFSVAVFTKDLWYGPDRAVTWTTLLAALILMGLGLYYLPIFPSGM